MEGLGLNPESMAAQLRRESGESISGETIRNWLAQKHYPQVRHLHALADAFGVDLRIFFEPQEAPEPQSPPEKPARPRRVRAPKRS